VAFTTVPVSIRARFDAMSTAAFAVSATVAGTFKTNLTRSDGPFYFLVVPHPDIELKVRSSYRRELFPVIGLLMCLIVALIY
jgi:hypothetical protein